MGTLRHCKYGQEHTLSSQHLIGRASRCHLRLDSPRVSSYHAELRWTGSTWELCDLASTNGTYLDGQRLERGEHRVVMAGSRLAFGHASDVYELISGDAPRATATSADGIRREGSEDSLPLPSDETPACYVYHKGNQWYVEEHEQPLRRVESGATLLIRDTIWTLDLPIVMAGTAVNGGRPLTLDSLLLRFQVSRDKEHVDLELECGIERKRLASSVCWVMLLTLAEERLDDRKRGLPEFEAGWMDVRRLQNELDLEADALNQQVFRARHTMAVAGVHGHSELIERKPGRIRLGVGRIEIVKA